MPVHAEYRPYAGIPDSQAPRHRRVDIWRLPRPGLALKTCAAVFVFPFRGKKKGKTRRKEAAAGPCQSRVCVALPATVASSNIHGALGRGEPAVVLPYLTHLWKSASPPPRQNFRALGVLEMSPARRHVG